MNVKGILHKRHDNLEKLPHSCATRDDFQKRPIIIVKGQTGFYSAQHLKTDEDIARYNEERGVEPHHVEAMRMGSLYGWHTQGADADYWKTQIATGAASGDSS